MNEVQAMAKAGEAAGAVLGTALMTARQRTVAASKTSAAASRRLAKQAHRRLADHGIDREHLQETLTDNMWRARHELASRIEPPPRRRSFIPFAGSRNWPWLVGLAVLGVIAVVAVLSRRPQVEPTEDEQAEEQTITSGNGSAQGTRGQAPLSPARQSG